MNESIWTSQLCSYGIKLKGECQDISVLDYNVEIVSYPQKEAQFNKDTE